MMASRQQVTLIGLLIVTALVLATLLALPIMPSSASASSVATGAGDLTMVAAGPGGGGDDLLTVVDGRSGRMISYQLQGGNRLVPIGMARIFETGR